MQLTTMKVCRHPMHGTHATSIKFERENGWQIRQGENCRSPRFYDLTLCIEDWNQKCQQIVDEMPIEECKPLEFPVSHLEGWITALGFYREAFVSPTAPPTPPPTPPPAPKCCRDFDFERPINEAKMLELFEGIKNRDTLAAFDALRYLLIS